jgi:hypothetical protein
VKRLAASLVLALLLAPASVDAGYTYYGPYHPRKLVALAELPAGILVDIEEHLRARLGDVYGELRFKDGEAIDRRELLRVNPNAANYRWEVPAYTLHFTWDAPVQGVARYHADIDLRADGSVLKEIDLPAFGKFARKRSLVSLDRARTIVDAKTYEGAWVELLYSSERDSLFWRLTSEEVCKPSDRSGCYGGEALQADIDAHDGTLLRESTITIFH